MAKDEQGVVGRFLSTLSKPFRRQTTPEPIMPLWKSGIQEPVLVQGVSIPALYATVQESVVLRTTIKKCLDAATIGRKSFIKNARTVKKNTNTTQLMNVIYVE